MKKLSAMVLVSIFSLGVVAEEVANTSSPHHFFFNGGFTRGGFAFGADYENNFHRTYGIGGYVRMYGDNDDTSQGDITTFGAFIRPHFTRQSWDFFLSPGFGFVQEERAGNNNDDESYFGPSLGIGLLYQLTYAAAIGVENFQIYGWFGDDHVMGIRSNELLAKFRYSF